MSVIYRRQSDADQARVRDLKLVYDLQLDREISARREYELTVESQLRRELASELRAQAADEVAALRAELAALRTNLEILFDTDLAQRPALETRGRRAATGARLQRWDRNGGTGAPGRLGVQRSGDVGARRTRIAGRTDESPIIDVPEEPVPPRSRRRRRRERVRDQYEPARGARVTLHGARIRRRRREPPVRDRRSRGSSPARAAAGRAPAAVQPNRRRQPNRSPNRQHRSRNGSPSRSGRAQGWHPVAAEGHGCRPAPPGSNWAGADPGGRRHGGRRRARIPGVDGSPSLPSRAGPPPPTATPAAGRGHATGGVPRLRRCALRRADDRGRTCSGAARHRRRRRRRRQPPAPPTHRPIRGRRRHDWRRRRTGARAPARRATAAGGPTRETARHRWPVGRRPAGAAAGAALRRWPASSP